MVQLDAALDVGTGGNETGHLLCGLGSGDDRCESRVRTAALLGFLPGFGQAGLHILGNVLHLLIAERAMHRRQPFLLLVAGVLARRLVKEYRSRPRAIPAR